MPIFEFHCAKCQKDFESLVMGSDDESAICCPECGAKDVSRQMSGFSTGPGAWGITPGPTSPMGMGGGGTGGGCGSGGGGGGFS